MRFQAEGKLSLTLCGQNGQRGLEASCLKTAEPRHGEIDLKTDLRRESASGGMEWRVDHHEDVRSKITSRLPGLSGQPLFYKL